MYTEKLISPTKFIGKPLSKLEMTLVKMKKKYADLSKEGQIQQRLNNRTQVQKIAKEMNILERNYESVTIAVHRHLNEMFIITPFWVTTKN